MGLVGCGITLVYAIASLSRFDRFRTGVDLDIFTQAVDRYSRGDLPWSYVKGTGFNLLGDHFSPVLFWRRPGEYGPTRESC